MQRAIDAARRAFDETSWSTDRAFRKQCLGQLQPALEDEQEELREELIAEVGCPRMVTHGPQLDLPLADGLRHPIELIDSFPWEQDLGDAMVSLTGTMTTRKVWHEPVGVVGAIVPWNYPFEVTINKLGQALATGNTVVLKAAPDTPFNATRLGRLVAERTDIPAGVAQRHHGVGPPRRRGAHPVRQGRPHLLHRLDRGGQADHGEGRRDHEAPLPRARRQVGRHRPRRRRPRARPRCSPSACACTPGRAAPRRRGCCCPDPATTRASSW